MAFCPKYSLLEKKKCRSQCNPISYNHAKHGDITSFVYCPYCEQRVLFPFLIKKASGVSAIQNTVMEVFKAEDAPGVALGTNIGTHVHMGHLAGG